MSITTAPWIDAVYPPLIEPGKSAKLTVYGRNLPGGEPEVFEHELGLGWCFNRWRPSDLKPRLGATEADAKPWLDHLERLVPEAADREHLTKYMGHRLQHTAIKVNHGIMMGGLPGIGKDALWAPFLRALGLRNTVTISMADLESSQNDWAAGVAQVVLNEVHSASRVRTADTLKPYCTAPPVDLRINTKHVVQYKIPNRIGIIAFTNRRDAMAIEKGDRRWFIVWCECEPAEKEYYAALWHWYEHGGYEIVAGYLMGLSLEGWNPHAEPPVTEAKREMARDGRSELQAIVEDAIEAGTVPDVVNAEDWAVRLNHAAGPRGRGISGRSLVIVMKHAGAVPLNGGKIVRFKEPAQSGADKGRLYAVRNGRDYLGKTPEELSSIFASGWAIGDKEGAIGDSRTLENAKKDFGNAGSVVVDLFRKH